jgi:hypothetical protein
MSPRQTTRDDYQPLTEGYQPVGKGYQPTAAPGSRPTPPTGGSSVARPTTAPANTAPMAPAKPSNTTSTSE